MWHIESSLWPWCKKTRPCSWSQFIKPFLELCWKVFAENYFRVKFKVITKRNGNIVRNTATEGELHCRLGRMMSRSMFCVESNCFLAGIQGQVAVLLHKVKVRKSNAKHCESLCCTVSFGLVLEQVCNWTLVVSVSFPVIFGQIKLAVLAQCRKYWKFYIIWHSTKYLVRYFVPNGHKVCFWKACIVTGHTSLAFMYFYTSFVTAWSFSLQSDSGLPGEDLHRLLRKKKEVLLLYSQDPAISRTHSPSSTSYRCHNLFV